MNLQGPGYVEPRVRLHANLNPSVVRFGADGDDNKPEQPQEPAKTEPKSTNPDKKQDTSVSGLFKQGWGLLTKGVEKGLDQITKKLEGKTEGTEAKSTSGTEEAITPKGDTAKLKQIFEALEADDVEKAKGIIENNFDVNSRSSQGKTALMAVAVRGENELLDLLISKGADANVTDGRGRNALMLAVRYGRKETAEKLIPLTTDLNARTKRIVKDDWGSEKVVQEEQNVLEIAAENKQGALAGVLLDAGADPKNGLVLCYAVASGDLDLVNRLLTPKTDGAPSVDVHKGGKPFDGRPVHIAASKGQDEVLKRLLEAGADKDDLRSKFGSPLVYAASKGHVTSAQVLLDAKADIHAVHPKKKLTALAAAEAAGLESDDPVKSAQCLTIAELLREAGAEATEEDNSGW